MTIALSIDAILAQVYAQTALRYEINTPDSTILTTNSNAALRTLAISAASTVAMAILPIVADTNLDTEELREGSTDIITFDLTDCREISLPALRLLAERAIADFILSEVYAATDGDTSQTYLDQHQKLIGRLRISVRNAFPTAIRPFP